MTSNHDRISGTGRGASFALTSLTGGHKAESMHDGMLQTEDVIIRVAEADKDDVDLAVNAARKAFDEGAWPRTPGAQRGLVLNKCAGPRCCHDCLYRLPLVAYLQQQFLRCQ